MSLKSILTTLHQEKFAASRGKKFSLVRAQVFLRTSYFHLGKGDWEECMDFSKAKHCNISICQKTQDVAVLHLKVVPRAGLEPAQPVMAKGF